MTDSAVDSREELSKLRSLLSEEIIGQDHILNSLIIALLADGHLLVEGLPGLAKTRVIKSLGRHLDAGLSRIQFTPDLLPSDITGGELYYHDNEGGEFKFSPGPIFNNLILADEVNRAPAKVQAALLEAMAERQVTVAGQSHALPELFLVLATQNPIEQEGTYPLPEAQMDRFLMKLLIHYPDPVSEAKMIRLVRAEERGAATDVKGDELIPQQAILAARKQVSEIHVAEAIEQYIVDIITATRKHNDDELGKWIRVGASPRGALGLDRCSRANAWLDNREFVTPEDVRGVIHDVLRHRLLLSYEAQAEGVTADQVIDRLLQQVPIIC